MHGWLASRQGLETARVSSSQGARYIPCGSVLCPVPAAVSSPHEAPNCGSLHPALVLLGRASCSEPRGKGGVAAYVCAKVSASLCRGGADVRGRRGGAWLTPEVTPSLTSLRSAADGGGPVLGTGGGTGVELHNGKQGGPCPASSFQAGSS